MFFLDVPLTFRYLYVALYFIVSDVGTALGSILLTPGEFSDKTISLNGPLTDCETAACAFSIALGKPVIYEQATYSSYKEVSMIDPPCVYLLNFYLSGLSWTNLNSASKCNMSHIDFTRSLNA